MLGLIGIPPAGLLGLVDTIGGISLFAGAGLLAYRVFVSVKRAADRSRMTGPEIADWPRNGVYEARTIEPNPRERGLL